MLLSTPRRRCEGSTETQVRAAVGEPSRVSTNPERAIKTLWYDSRGVWFSFPLDAPRLYADRVFVIGVTQPK